MTRALVLVAVASLMITAAPAWATTQSGTGSHDGGFFSGYGDCAVVENVTPDTAFQLTSPNDDGDWDIDFYDANGDWIDNVYSFGDEDGVVPSGAAYAEACLWSTETNDDVVGIVLEIVDKPAGSSDYCYADGADYGTCG